MKEVKSGVLFKHVIRMSSISYIGDAAPNQITIN
jgi:hypothetical protein